MKLDEDMLLDIIKMNGSKISGRKIAEKYGVHHSAINRFLAGDTHQRFWVKHNDKPLAGGTLQKPHEKRSKVRSDKKSFIFTSAQNNSFVHEGFLGALKVCADHINADIIVGTYTYNKSGYQKSEKGDEWYHQSIREYIQDTSLLISEDLVWCGDLNISPTAVNPIMGLQNHTGSLSCIIPHAKVNLESVPTHKLDLAKFIYTTGSVTEANYIKKKSGQKAENHHIYGAILVEIDKDGSWFARQIIAESKTGNFYDLDTYYTKDGVCHGNRVEAINWGDIHVEKLDNVAGKVSFGVGIDSEAGLPYQVVSTETNMLDYLRPKYCFYHDTIDFKVRNHHNRKNPLFKIKMMYDKTEDVRFGLKQAGRFLSIVDREWCQSVVVNSNHDAALKRWAEECVWSEDPVNAEFLLSCQLELVKSIKSGNEDFCIFEYMVKDSVDGDIDHVKFLKLDEPFEICGKGGTGIQCGYHGHTGNNGARGSIQSYRITGVRYNLGHTHACAIKDGIYVSGVTGKMDMGYNKGMGGWSHSHIVTYCNSKRAIVTIKGGRYRASHKFLDGEWVNA